MDAENLKQMVKRRANKDVIKSVSDKFKWKEVPIPKHEYVSTGLKGERNWNSTKKLMLKTIINRPET